MPTAVYDSSLVTRRKQNLTLYSGYKSLQTAVNNGTSVRREQPTYQLETIVTLRHENSANYTPADANGAACPCSAAVGQNPGGNNSTNWQ